MAKLNSTFAENDGVITLGQARACGLSPRQIYLRVKTGQWEAYARGVFLSLQHEHSDAAAVRAVVAAHYRSVAHSTTAAWWHSMIPDLPRPLTLCVPITSHRPIDVAEDIALRHRPLPAEDVTDHRGLSVTSPELTVLTALETIADPAGFLDRCLQRTLVTTGELTACLERNAGMHGLRTARGLLDTLEAGAESEAERLFLDLLRIHGITGWTQQVWFGRSRIDFAWTAEKVSVEINGWAYHRSRDRFEADNAKAAMLAANGWLPLSYTWKQLTENPEGCIAQVVAALALRRL
ncbi:MAG: type IV toxin-antitoxin system AbiEi family antitoxin domain-containing protein [Gordonia sp. (in: high G+C Gram-positive bacteria)]|uniref:type IV toxin-antitoxin system AbiEi family antitoxin domain-containing protein n=1 Tax=Gordonia sp. (in: high G+C Gram-positive bacteria) TaxID=84139 RepID=UPI003BB50978